ncbi:hypothetical protein NLG97_g3923 [Lecanicillium saksenae]|uniref:Uncharacterized protein n=1 Tax=Lecanicillium saksenae TaxID=468837 RepID=A0ACC1QXB9_9HYPO|nr:hypothetical protein NLG97_g3923 [Lecanicillium saksenae]
MAGLVESSLCTTEFPDVVDPYNDPRCKSEGIQADLAWIIGLESTISVIPGLIMSIPYGIIADKYGPNIVLGLIWVGQFFSEGGHLLVCLNPQLFNVRWIWASSLMTVIGGGGASWAAMRFLIGASLVSEKNRITLFFYLQAYGTCMAFLTGPVGYFLVSRGGPVWAQVAGVAIIASMIIPGFALPRKLSNTPLVAEESEHLSIKARVTDLVNTTTSTLRLIFVHNLRLTLLLIGVMFTTLGAYEVTFRLQYATKRFGWTWAKANLLSSVVAISNLTVLSIVLPAASYLMLKYKFSTLKKDLWLARGSGCIQVIGSFLTALAPSGPTFVASVALYECNKGYMPSVVSLIASVAKLAGVEQQTTIYACVSTMVAFGAMLSGPVMASAFRIGLRWGESWYGLPFVAAGVLQLLTLFILLYVRHK